MLTTKFVRRCALAASLMAIAGSPNAAVGELGTGVPHFGIYGTGFGVSIRVFRLDEATIPIAAGCTTLQVTPTTMGPEAYKITAAMLLTAKLSGRKVRFYSHAPRDGDGCGADYVELI